MSQSVNAAVEKLGSLTKQEFVRRDCGEEAVWVGRQVVSATELGFGYEVSRRTILG
jgi:hypothetical protein